MLQTQATRRTDDAAHAKQIASGWGQWLHDRQWSQWATLTSNDTDRSGRGHRRRVSEASLRADFCRFVRRLERIAQGPVSFVSVLEGVEAGHPHFHVLLGGCERLSPDAVRGAWKAGLSKVERWDSRRGAAFYLSKTLGRDPDAVDMSAQLPPLLRRGPVDSETMGDSIPPAMLKLLRTDDARESTERSPLATVRVSGVETVDLDTWAAHMARIICERARVGQAA